MTPPESPPAGTAERSALDFAGREPALLCFVTAVFWLLVGSIFGDLASLKFQFPDWLADSGALTFGRLRTAHLNAMIYGWSSLAMLGVSCWLIPRLVRQPLAWPRLAVGGAMIWNIGLLSGVPGLLAGATDGLEWLELDWRFSDPWLVLGGAMVGGALLRTVLGSKVEHLYVSVWYTAAAFVWFPILFVIGNLRVYTGVESAAVNWFYGHNALGFWLTAINLGAIYYLLPKVLGRPIHSYQLSLVGFWAFAFFYSLNGMHHLVGGPIPTWMITTSIVASGMMVIPVGAVAVNHHMTMVGRFGALRYSPTLRFVVLGAISYTAVSLQGIFTAFVEVNRVTHFTQWTIAHSHVGVYAFVTLTLFGSIYYILPRLVEREWPSASLIRWHFWLSLGGIAAYVLALIVGGVLQGMALLDPARPFEESVTVTLPWLAVRTVAGLVLTAGHLVFAWHIALMLSRHLRRERRLPPWHEAQPRLYEESG
ncbi:MAG: cbb3-type cytochrome c oxidase subunit I [Pseudomonadota bacterium]|nr:cbb3-type cytochrome c oxidase subunit I [Pseudomonadota bacterium]